ncbi:MAG TPA: hypothetical protein VH988_33030 [Thermoanaerobaculia bacterium]|jgi:hypothetical protein|nr:hypothetical protein [Thermoanaerobaculia bacterium]
MAPRVRISGLVLVAVVASLSLAAQPAPEQTPPVINETIDVRVVNVETVVTDAQGKRVKGLSGEEKDRRLRVELGAARPAGRGEQQHVVFAVDDPVAGAVLWGETRVSL